MFLIKQDIKITNKTVNLIENPRKCDYVIDYGTGKSTDISIYNTIYNILTLHYIQYIISNSFRFYLYKIKYVCFSKNAYFLLWLTFPDTEWLEAFSNHNGEIFGAMVGEICKIGINAHISAKSTVLASFSEVTNFQFWLRKWRNRFRNRMALNTSNYNKNCRNQKTQVPEPMQFGSTLFWAIKYSYFNKKTC